MNFSRICVQMHVFSLNFVCKYMHIYLLLTTSCFETINKFNMIIYSCYTFQKNSSQHNRVIL